MTTTTEKQPSFIQRLIAPLDSFQRRQKWLGLPYAVVKKFGDDDGGNLAALMTYYGFLSLFPLLIVATAFAQIVSQGDTALKDKIINSVVGYFPAIGDGLVASLQTPARSGLALIVGSLVAFYGVRGIANSVQYTLHIVWAVPRHKRAGFPLSMLRSFGIVIFTGIGLIVSAILSSYATNSSLPLIVKLLIGTGGFIMLFAVFWGVFTYGSSARKRPIANIPGAIIAALGLQFLQAIGSYLILNQLHRYSGLNAQFAIVIVLLFWIYLQAQVFIFALEFNTVRAHRLYPRSLDGEDPTEADDHAHKLYATRDNYVEV